MTEELSRTSALASRHTALGSGLEDWNGMGTAWSYDSDPEQEHDAIRDACGMFDMSPLKKVLVAGKDAAAVLDHLVTRDVSRIGEGQAAYTSVLSDKGTMADDAIVYNKGNNNWMIVHGSGDTMNLLNQSAQGKSADIQFTDDLHNISVQGPDAFGVLQAASNSDIADLAYFDHKPVSLFGNSCLLSRTGYTGERGYELFVDKAVVGSLWDSLVDAGVTPCSFASLDKVRIEAGLLFYGYDMTEEQTPFEVGLGFTVTKGKNGYRGHDALQQSMGKEKLNNVCLDIDHSDMIEGGESIKLDGATIGVVNSPCYSHRLNKSLALSHVNPQAAKPGTRLEVCSDTLTYAAEVVAMPVFDPQKLRTK